MIRFAQEKDIPRIGELLSEVDLVHHEGRPDIFKIGRKYDNGQLLEILKDTSRPIFVAVDDTDKVLGYAFCIFQQHNNDNVLTDIKTLYIDDICVGHECRRQGVGKDLYNAVVDYARSNGCYNITLNVWSCNLSAMRFYESLGLSPMKVCMEKIL
ncbi:MAG: GNAT family N-acetyltransferase [Ruminococcaceae bacterium]|nr:GNAT family N-acetyltransferase [Oscillospiraceae bacterium]